MLTLGLVSLFSTLLDSNRGKEGYNPDKVSLFGNDEKPVGPPGNRGKEGYNPDVVSLFGNDAPPVSTEGGKASQRGKEGYNPSVGKYYVACSR